MQGEELLHERVHKLRSGCAGEELLSGERTYVRRDRESSDQLHVYYNQRVRIISMLKYKTISSCRENTEIWLQSIAYNVYRTEQLR